MLREFRFAVRSLSKAPRFALTAIVVLALGIGASTAMFSVVYHVLLRPLPYPEPGRLVFLRETSVRRGGWSPTAPATFADWRDRAVVTLTTAQGGLRVAAANPAARTAGIQSGQAVADARALLPEVKTLPAAPADDLACLAALADWCGRYTPWVATDGLDPDGGGGLMLDIRGCTHLFGGEQTLLDTIARGLGG